MKKILNTLVMLLVTLGAAIAQNADPQLDMGWVAPATGIVPNNGVANLNVTTGNGGNDNIVSNSLIVTVTAGANAELLGVAGGSDPRWTILSLTAGAGNSIKLMNTNGGFGSFDLADILLAVRGASIGGPNLIVGNVDYDPVFNPLIGANNVTQGDVAGNNNGQTGFLVIVALPLNFTDVSVKDDVCNGVISWKTMDEQNVLNFEVQQSFDGSNYTTVKTVPSQGSGNHSYSVSVAQMQKTMYYRIVAVDLDNRKAFSTAKALKLGNCTKVSIVQVFPIPAYRDQAITMRTNSNEKITYRVIDMAGKTIQTGSFIRIRQIRILIGGTYLLEMTSDGFKETQQVVVQ